MQIYVLRTIFNNLSQQQLYDEMMNSNLKQYSLFMVLVRYIFIPNFKQLHCLLFDSRLISKNLRIYL